MYSRIWHVLRIRQIDPQKFCADGDRQSAKDFYGTDVFPGMLYRNLSFAGCSNHITGFGKLLLNYILEGVFERYMSDEDREAENERNQEFYN